MQITFEFQPGAGPKEIAQTLRMQAGIFEGMDKKVAASNANTKSNGLADHGGGEAASKPEAVVKTPEPKKPAGKKAAAPVEEDETFGDDEEAEAVDLGDEAEEDEDTKITIKEVIAGFQAYAKATSREKAAGVLKKFKVKSVHDLKPEQFPKVMAELARA